MKGKGPIERSIAVMTGDLDLINAIGDHLWHVGKALAAMPVLQRGYASHCTGKAAFVALIQSLGPSVMHPCPAGTVLEF